MLKSLNKEMCNCGVIFNVNNKGDFTSLSGTDRKKLLKFLPPKLIVNYHNSVTK